jgi:hypothetical protein
MLRSRHEGVDIPSLHPGLVNQVEDAVKLHASCESIPRVVVISCLTVTFSS